MTDFHFVMRYDFPSKPGVFHYRTRVYVYTRILKRYTRAYNLEHFRAPPHKIFWTILLAWFFFYFSEKLLQDRTRPSIRARIVRRRPLLLRTKKKKCVRKYTHHTHTSYYYNKHFFFHYRACVLWIDSVCICARILGAL